MATPEPNTEASVLLLGEKKQQFKTVRRVSYAALAVVILASIYAVWVMNGGSISPFYIPLPQLMFVMLLGAFLLNLTSVVFGALEVHAASGGEQRYLIARHGYSTGLVTAAFAAFFLVVIAALGPVIDAQIDYENRISIGVNSSLNVVTAPFNVSADYTGSSYLSTVEIRSLDGNPFNVTIYPLAEYNTTSNNGTAIVRANEVTFFKVTFVSGSIETTPKGNFTNLGWSRLPGPAESLQYMVVLERKEYDPAQLLYHQDRVLDPAFVSSVYTLLLLLIVLNGAAAGYNRWLRQKWRAYGEKNY